ncbi:MAG: holo-ACP synthase [Halanaerobiaceae bacterium]|nr:holo-ACP synthase [Halanaerobiaceae bacterium]
MIKGLGVDLVDIKRIEELINKRGQAFLEKVFTLREIEYCESKAARYQHYAARFAAKEAVVKMLAGAEGIGWKDIEVLKAGNGKPELVLSGQARKAADRLGIKRLHLSISHEKELAIAQVIGEDD